MLHYILFKCPSGWPVVPQRVRYILNFCDLIRCKIWIRLIFCAARSASFLPNNLRWKWKARATRLQLLICPWTSGRRIVILNQRMSWSISLFHFLLYLLFVWVDIDSVAFPHQFRSSLDYHRRLCFSPSFSTLKNSEIFSEISDDLLSSVKIIGKNSINNYLIY